MKKLALGLVLSLGASAALAGGYEEPIVTPVMTPEVIETHAASSSEPSPYSVIGTLTLLVFATAFSN